MASDVAQPLDRSAALGVALLDQAREHLRESLVARAARGEALEIARRLPRRNGRAP